MKLNYFNFKEFKGKILLTNDFGKHVFLEKTDFQKLITHDDELTTEIIRELNKAGMVFDGSDLSFTDSNLYKLRSFKSPVGIATSLHIFVVTTGCNLDCVYCQANNGTTVPNCFMDQTTAEKAVDIALQSPEPNLNFEFQGGEPLLNYPIIRHIVEYAERNKGRHCIQYNIVTNLTLIKEEMIDFFSEYNVGISTSVDGFATLHDRNRPFKDGKGSYNAVRKGIEKARAKGIHVGAIETTTRNSLYYAKELLEEYRELGFNTVFIRPLTPLGKANKQWDDIGYSAEEYLRFYRKIIDEIIRLNKNGVQMQEQHTGILIKRINAVPVNYMELRSPCGGGIGQLAFFADGRVFTCDEGRMLAEMGNDAFLLGNVYKDTYQSLIKNSVCRAVCSSSILETIPSCCDCVYQPYCGTCPVVTYALNDDIFEKEPRSYRCQIYAGMLDYLFELLLEHDKETITILNRWSA